MANRLSDTLLARSPGEQATLGSRLWRPLFGVVLALAGLAIVAGVFVAAFSTEPSLAAIGLKLGLAFSTLISALGQAAFLLGLWLFWSAVKPRGRAEASARKKNRARPT